MLFMLSNSSADGQVVYPAMRGDLLLEFSARIPHVSPKECLCPRLPKPYRQSVPSHEGHGGNLSSASSSVTRVPQFVHV